MKQSFIFLILISCFWHCETKVQDQSQVLTDEVPVSDPLPYKEELVPGDKLIHKGSFNPDLSAYYFTLSDKNYSRFDTYVTYKQNDQWSDPAPAFFNSKHSEHGISFSSDGKTIYFTSTRPANRPDYIDTWHLWKIEKLNEIWSLPTLVDIPNLRDKLVSHPTISDDGTLYFHSSNADYSEMDLYQTKLTNGEWSPAEKVVIDMENSPGKCTPFIAPDESFLLFANIGEQLDLYITFNDGDGNWSGPTRLNDKINTKGQGNPYVTPDQKYLFFTAVSDDQKWKVKKVNFSDELSSMRAQ